MFRPAHRKMSALSWPHTTYRTRLGQCDRGCSAKAGDLPGGALRRERGGGSPPDAHTVLPLPRAADGGPGVIAAAQTTLPSFSVERGSLEAYAALIALIAGGDA